MATRDQPPPPRRRGRLRRLFSVLCASATITAASIVLLGDGRYPRALDAAPPEGAREERTARDRGAPPPPGGDAADAARAHLESIRRRYEADGSLSDFRARGLGAVGAHYGLTLTLTAPSGSDLSAPGIRSVGIADVSGRASCDSLDPSKLTIWVRVSGPEVFAGSAVPDVAAAASSPSAAAGGEPRPCSWRYDFDLRVPGSYVAEAKVLLYDGEADVHPELCRTEVGAVPSPSEFNRTYPHHRGNVGFKFYGMADSCCELCTRTAGCAHWSSPGFGHFQECEMFFGGPEPAPAYAGAGRAAENATDAAAENSTDAAAENSTDAAAKNATDAAAAAAAGTSIRRGTRRRLGPIPPAPRSSGRRRRRRLIQKGITKPWPPRDRPAHGVPRGEPTPRFLGCGWSSLLSFESPCIDPADDLIHGSGVEFRFGPAEASSSSSSAGADVDAAADPPPRRDCVPSDERLGDASRGRWVRRPFPNETMCPLPMNFGGSWQHDLNYDGDRPLCWHRDDMTKHGVGCREMGCRFVIGRQWRSRLKGEARWFGTWEPYGCSYREFTNAELQQCLNARRVKAFDLRGASLIDVVRTYLNQRLEGIKLSAGGEGTVRVVVDTLKMPHRVWHDSADAFRSDLVRGKPNATDRVMMFPISGFYYSSEREVRAHVGRSLQFSRIAEEVLVPKGHMMLNAFDMTAAFTYDTAGQMDGLHISGPPIKMLVKNLFHYLCSDVINP